MTSKNLTVYVDNQPKFLVLLTITSKVLDIKEYFNKSYPNYDIRMLLNKNTELPVFTTNQYDTMDISSVWDQIDNGHIYLTKRVEVKEEEKYLLMIMSYVMDPGAMDIYVTKISNLEMSDRQIKRLVDSTPSQRRRMRFYIEYYDYETDEYKIRDGWQSLNRKELYEFTNIHHCIVVTAWSDE